MARSRAGEQDVELEHRLASTSRAADRERRLAVIRDRVARGFYHTEWVIRQVAVRLLASGDLDRVA